MFNVCRLAFHLLEEEAQANLDTAIVGKVRKFGGIDIVGRGVNITVLIEQLAKFLKELYGELEVLEEIYAGADGETILELVLCLLESLFSIAAEILCELFGYHISYIRLCHNEGTERNEVNSPLDTEIQLCDTALEVEIFRFGLCTLIDDSAKVCTLNLIGKFRLDCEAEGEGEFEGKAQVVITDTVKVGKDVFLIDGGSSGTETGNNTNLCVGNHY